MNKPTQPDLAGHNSRMVLFVSFITVIFQITAYKSIWNLEWASRLLNTTVLIIFSTYAYNALLKYKFKGNVVGFYIIPGFLVYIGFCINISIGSISNPNIMNKFGLLIPWAIYLAVPGLIRSGKLDVSKLWLYFNYFMLATVSLSVFEYYLLFSGIIAPRQIVASGMPFLSGYFSMLYELETGEPHYRFYASFSEPGTLAMFLLPAMAYASLHRKFFSLVIYIGALYLSDSLGGFIGAAMLIVLYVYFRFNSRPLLAVVYCLLLASTIAIIFSTELFKRYEEKELSATVREENAVAAVSGLPDKLLKYPFGLPITESTEEAERNKYYAGSNFTPGNAFDLGGILSLVGYLPVLFVSFWYAMTSLFRKYLSLDEQAAVVSIFCLLPFIFQRTVVWDSSVFALLFAPYVIAFLRGSPTILTYR